jgi:hypothetical protein
MKRISFLLALALLSGCATGVQMTAEEAAACKAEGCSVWTERELRGLIGEAFKQGYVAGVKSI